ncbi:MAG TPA: Hint domain-containing protein, partial [Acetobacteraceae bacterium]|nr:Hint domain-containing protein [Acetobacteraceae bacterium]
ARVTIGALSGTPTIVYAAAPALVALPGAGALPVTLRNLGAGDILDFVGVSSSVPSSGLFVQAGAATAAGSLDVTGASGDTANLPVTTSAPYLAFTLAPDSAGGTRVTAAACYRAGTRIATARGEVPIEHLRRGDLIRTLSGRFVRAVWLGRRRIDCRRLARPEEAWPVRVAAHAFAPGRPARDLYLSPDHAVFVDGALVPVRYLLNGATIAQRPVARVEYWHVELPAHGVLLAENLPAESYLDTGNRAAFAGTRHRRPLPAAAALRLWRRRACAPLLASGPKLAALHARLLARAGSLGHALTGAPALRVIARGREAEPLGEGRFRLPAGTRAVRVLTRSFVPAHLAGPGGDARRLGVAVGQVHLDGEALALDDARLGPGWHAPESGWRWTTGEAVIATGGAREIALQLAIAGRYWQAG